MGKGLEWTLPPKKIHKWPTSTWKDTQHHQSSGRCKSKLQADTFTPARMKVIVTVMIVMVTIQKIMCWQRCEKNWNLHTLLVGM